jgi:hypothetical protein
LTEPQPGTYAERTMAELRRLGADRDQIRQIMTEVWVQLGDTPDQDLSTVFGPPEQFAGDALAGRRPVRVDYLRRLRTELHARGVPSERIGEVLAEVDAHVSDAGDDPATAFGPPDRYAARIAEEIGATPQPPPPAARRILTGAAASAGTLLAVEGVVGLIRHHPAPVTLAVLLTAVLIPVLSQSVLLLGRRSSGFGCAAALGLFVATQIAQVAVLVWFRQPVLADLPAGAVAGVGLAAVLGMIMVFRPGRRQPMSTPVIDPRPGAEHDGPIVWDTDEKDGDAPRGIGWGAAALGVVEIAALTVVVLLLR